MKTCLVLLLVAKVGWAESLKPPPPRLVPDSGEVPLDAQLFVAANETLEVFDVEHQPVPFEREGPVGKLSVHAPRDGLAYTVRFLDPGGQVRLDWPRAPLEFHFVAKAGWKPAGRAPVLGEPRREEEWGFISKVRLPFQGASAAYLFTAENDVETLSWTASPRDELVLRWPLFKDERADRVKTRFRAVGLELDGTKSPASAWVVVHPPLDPDRAPWGLVFVDQLRQHRWLAAFILGVATVLIGVLMRRTALSS